MTTARFPKTKVVISQLCIYISPEAGSQKTSKQETQNKNKYIARKITKFGKLIDFHLIKRVPSRIRKPEVDFRLYGGHLENQPDVTTSP